MKNEGMAEGPAVNPMGGHAARAIFDGYDIHNFDFLRMQADFPY
jgi:hypothetical protein